jgi:hypothetical protein
MDHLRADNPDRLTIQRRGRRILRRHGRIKLSLFRRQADPVTFGLDADVLTGVTCGLEAVVEAPLRTAVGSDQVRVRSHHVLAFDWNARPLLPLVEGDLLFQLAVATIAGPVRTVLRPIWVNGMGVFRVRGVTVIIGWRLWWTGTVVNCLDGAAVVSRLRAFPAPFREADLTERRGRGGEIGGNLLVQDAQFAGTSCDLLRVFLGFCRPNGPLERAAARLAAGDRKVFPDDESSLLRLGDCVHGGAFCVAQVVGTTASRRGGIGKGVGDVPDFYQVCVRALLGSVAAPSQMAPPGDSVPLCTASKWYSHCLAVFAQSEAACSKWPTSQLAICERLGTPAPPTPGISEFDRLAHGCDLMRRASFLGGELAGRLAELGPGCLDTGS